MPATPKHDKWVYVAVVDPAGNAQYVGLVDGEGTSFIPAFSTKEEAQAGLLDMAREKNKKYEVQAVLLEELEKDAATNGFHIYLLDGRGTILEKFHAAGR